MKGECSSENNRWMASRTCRTWSCWHESRPSTITTSLLCLAPNASKLCTWKRDSNQNRKMDIHFRSRSIFDSSATIMLHRSNWNGNKKPSNHTQSKLETLIRFNIEIVNQLYKNSKFKEVIHSRTQIVVSEKGSEDALLGYVKWSFYWKMYCELLMKAKPWILSNDTELSTQYNYYNTFQAS